MSSRTEFSPRTLVLYSGSCPWGMPLGKARPAPWRTPRAVAAGSGRPNTKFTIHWISITG